jgi:hypothetical protein
MCSGVCDKSDAICQIQRDQEQYALLQESLRDLNLVTAKGNVYSLLLMEKNGSSMPDLKVYVTADPNTPTGKASLFAGGDRHAVQQIALQVPANRLHLVSVDKQGVATQTPNPV